MVLRTLLSLAILQQDTELVADVLPSSLSLARENLELAWLTAFCYLLQVQFHCRVVEFAYKMPFAARRCCRHLL